MSPPTERLELLGLKAGAAVTRLLYLAGQMIQN